MENRKLNILILAGGESSEREVSLNSSKAITQSLQQAGHNVRMLDTFSGKFLTDASGRYLDESVNSATGRSRADDDNYLPVAEDFLETVKTTSSTIDVIILGLHGGLGENGTIQALLEMSGVPYTGSPMAASAVAMNKDISKHVMRSLGIPTAEWKTYDRAQWPVNADVAEDIVEKLIPALSLPLIIKPADGGSTVGLTLVEDEAAITEALDGAYKESDLVMVEKYIKGREITISILDGAALPPVEIKPTHKLYDYTCKYTRGKSQYFCPADIDPGLKDKLSADAVLFYETIGCRGYARVDFIVAPDGTYYCLELNTLPGMTELSLFPMAARAAGIEFAQLLEKLCYLAMEGR